MTDWLVVFDANTDAVLGAVRLGPLAPQCAGDCVITSDLTHAYVATANGVIWVVDLTTTPPSLASGLNPIEIPSHGIDLALTADERHLLVAPGNIVNQDLAVVDLATRTVVEELQIGPCVAVSVGRDGSVLAASQAPDSAVRRLTIDAAGQLTDTGDTLMQLKPLNLGIAPGEQVGLIVAWEPGIVRSFTLPGLVPIEALMPGPDFLPGALPDPHENRIYVRQNTAIEAYPFDAVTGDFGLAPFWTTAIGNFNACYGIESVALHPQGSKLYTVVPTGVRVLDAATGTPLALISHVNLIAPASITIAGEEPEAPVALDIKPGACPNLFDPLGHGVLPVAVLGKDQLDVTQLDVTTLRLSRADGTGGSVASNEGTAPQSEVADVSAPLDPDACACHKGESDGHLDLKAKFRSDELIAALQLDELPVGSEVELVLRGQLLDGTRITGRDCVRIVAPGAQPGRLAITTEPGGWVEITPLDRLLDGGGFGTFERSYPLGTRVSLTASELDGLPFLAWQVDGVTQKAGERTLVYHVKHDRAELRALYGGRRLTR